VVPEKGPLNGCVCVCVADDMSRWQHWQQRRVQADALLHGIVCVLS